MTPSESAPLLGNGGHTGHRNLPFARRVVNFMKGEGEPSWEESFKFFIFGSWLNILLIFVPLSVISHNMDWDGGLVFLFSFMAIVPLSRLLGEATDQLSVELGENMSGLLNASFGNAVEIIVGVAALLNGQLRIVQMSMIGSILSNMLLVLGCSFLAGKGPLVLGSFVIGFFNGTGAQACLMTLLCITLVVPAAYASTTKAGMENYCSDLDACLAAGLLFISRGTAMLLLGVYCAYLWFQLKSHPNLFIAPSPKDEQNSDVTVALAETDETRRMGTAAAGVALLLVTVVITFCAEYLITSIEETMARYSISKAFIGVILLPIVGNAADHLTAVWMATKSKCELTITICVGVRFVDQPLTLHFHNFETVMLFVSVFLVNLLLMSVSPLPHDSFPFVEIYLACFRYGNANYLEGLMLITLYLVIALACKLPIETFNHILIATSLGSLTYH
ncbi:uncharacterized protein EDB93DRAFT_1289944 [Suillus bovinus]|uniref:uncharacterized protein n=1 Tax=Suillus bovinus TaxID=48563 RepID=UPI001B876C81|nr:uncharacterized protein EDB93DRAFT_1289944 [Suillus bovinus]KAG2144118.1 hypothetical protein EDB93DRAFT_1289944 [Suillus bovinus]